MLCVMWCIQQACVCTCTCVKHCGMSWVQPNTCPACATCVGNINLLRWESQSLQWRPSAEALEYDVLLAAREPRRHTYRKGQLESLEGKDVSCAERPGSESTGMRCSEPHTTQSNTNTPHSTDQTSVDLAPKVAVGTKKPIPVPWHV
jgi:hypothetical protein